MQRVCVLRREHLPRSPINNQKCANTMAVPATIAGLARLIVVIGLPVATVVPTVEAKTQTIARIALTSGSFEARTIAALPIPNKLRRLPDASQMQTIISSVKDEITTVQVRSDAASDRKSCRLKMNKGPRDEGNPHRHGDNLHLVFSSKEPMVSFSK